MIYNPILFQIYLIAPCCSTAVRAGLCLTGGALSIRVVPDVVSDIHYDIGT
jgi:hypothetical protein